MSSINRLLETYLLENDLEPTTEAWYRRIVRVFCEWYGGDVPADALTPETLSRFLRDKRDGHSSHYCKSLRSGLLAVLREVVDGRKVRTVRLAKLHPHTWSHPEVLTLVHAARVLPARKRDFYKRICLVAWHTGLSQNDLYRIERRDFDEGGTLIFDRHKTGETVVAWVPPELLDGLPATGPLFPKRWSDEQFRKDFKRMVKAAGLAGTFKTLRKSSGTAAEQLTPGRGHEHLANSRRIFETHYLDRKRVHREPIRLPGLRPRP